MTARVISSVMEECGDGFRNTTVYDSNWCEHKNDKDYCPKCNVIIDKTIRLTNKQIIKKLKITKGFKINSIAQTSKGLEIHIRFKQRRKK